MYCFEKWETKADEENQKIWRYFTARVLGMAAVYFANIYFNILNQTIPLISTIFTFKVNLGCPGSSTKATSVPSGSTLIPITNYSICNEDEVGMNLLLIVD